MKHIELEQTRVNIGNQRVYLVVKLTNCLEPAIGSEIPASEVQGYLSLPDYKVVIREPKGGR
jgi:hypothetical protein